MLFRSSPDGDGFWLAELSDEIPNELPPPVIKINTVIEQFEDLRPGNIELYDSGMTWHTSPYREDFIDYTPFPIPVSLNATNKQCFLALGSGSLIIQAPNDGTTMRLTLHNVLYTPAVTYTLVSIGVLDGEGYHAIIGNGWLNLHSLDHICIGWITKTPHDLYKIVHSQDDLEVHMVKSVSTMELHRCMGHIAVASDC